MAISYISILIFYLQPLNRLLCQCLKNRLNQGFHYQGLILLQALQKPLRNLRYIGNTSGIIESLDELPKEVTYEKEKLLLFQEKAFKVKNKYERWRGVAELLQLKAKERLRDDILIYSSKTECQHNS